MHFGGTKCLLLINKGGEGAMLEELLNLTENYRWISFDLFDTLLYRVVSKPELIFELVERRYNEKNPRWISGFTKRRIKAEALARKHARYGEITIDKIYAELFYTQEICNKLEDIEKDVEINTCYPNQVMVKFLELCKKRGQKVVVTTDMYLDRDTIKKILFHIGVKYDRLFISCETGKTKLSGELFEAVMEGLGIAADQICHIGDNPKTDIQSPQKYGIQPFERLIQTNNIGLYDNKKDSVDTDILNTFVRSHLETILDGDEKMLARIGYSVLGPLLYEFCSWLHKIAGKEQDGRIAFVAREGYLIKQVYDEMYPAEKNRTEYVRLNKNMLRLPSLYKNPTLEQFIDTIPYREEYFCEDLAQLFLLEPQFVAQFLDEEGFSSRKIRRAELNSPEFKAVFDEILEQEIGKLQEQYILFIEYMKQIGVLDGKVLLVNNSINGSVQRSIDRIIENNIIGVQFVASKKCLKELGASVKVWFEDIEASTYNKQMFAQYSIVLEHFMFEMTGTAQYLFSEGEKVRVKCETVGMEKENAGIIQPIQEYALRFVRDWCKEDLSGIMAEGTGFRQYMEFLFRPKKEDALLVGNILDSDFDGTHKLFDVKRNERLTYAEAKNYARIKWQHGYFMTQKNGNRLNEKYDMEKRIKCLAKIISGVQRL